MKNNYVGMRANNLGWDAHLTIMYTGPVDEQQKEFIENLLSPYSSLVSRVLRWEIAMFGPDLDKPVLKVIPGPELWFIRRLLEKSEGVPNPSEFKAWVPHITLPDFGMFTRDIILPSSINLTDLGVH